MRNTRRAIAIAATTVLCGVATTTPAEAATEKFHIDLGTLVEETPPCGTEPIRWTGSYDMTVSVKKGAKGAIRLVTYVQNMRGTGTKTGGQYKLKSAYVDVSANGNDGSSLAFFPQSYARTGPGPDYRSNGVSVTIDTENHTMQVDASGARCKS